MIAGGTWTETETGETDEMEEGGLLTEDEEVDLATEMEEEKMKRKNRRTNSREVYLKE